MRKKNKKQPCPKKTCCCYRSTRYKKQRKNHGSNRNFTCESTNDSGIVTLSETGWSDSSVGVWNSETRTATLIKDIIAPTHIRFEINDFIFDANQHTVDGDFNNWVCALCIEYHHNITIRNLTIYNSWYAIRAENNKNLVIENCVFTKAEAAIVASGENITICGCTFRDMKNEALYFNNITNVAITNNSFYGTEYAFGVSDGAALRTIDELEMSQNLFNHCGFGVYLTNIGKGNLVENTFKGCTKTPIFVEDSPNLNIKNNVIE